MKIHQEQETIATVGVHQIRKRYSGIDEQSCY